MRSHNLGLRPYEKKTFIHLQNSIMRFQKCKDKTCYHLSWIKLSGVWLPWEKSKSRTIIDFSHTTYTMKHLTNTSFRLFKRLERKLPIQWQSKPVRWQYNMMYRKKKKKTELRLAVKKIIGHFFHPYFREGIVLYPAMQTFLLGQNWHLETKNIICKIHLFTFMGLSVTCNTVCFQPIIQVWPRVLRQVC